MAEAMLGRLPLSAVRGPRDALEQRLAGRHGDLWLRELKNFLQKRPTWKNSLMGLELGRYRSGTELLSGLRRDPKVRLGRWVHDMEDFPVEPRSTAVDLYKFTVRELCDGSRTRRQAYASAQVNGYELCTPEVGPTLRERYLNQPCGLSHLEIAMKPFDNGRGRKNGFILYHSEGLLMLSGHMGDFFDEDALLDADQELVFMRYR